MTYIWLKNGANFLVTAEYRWLSDQWEINKDETCELETCEPDGKVIGRVRFRLSELSNIFEQ